MNEKMKARMFVMSVLSDAQELSMCKEGLKASKNINIVKYVIIQCNGDLEQEIDPQEMVDKYHLMYN